MTDPVTALATDYFEYVAKSFPVMCASDEFHFLPRAQAASRYYDQVEDLSSNRIDEYICVLKQYQKEGDRLAGRAKDPDTVMDFALLKGNIAGALIELEMKETWRHNPLLYLKVAFIGLDHALTKPSREEKEREERALARLYAIPRILQQGVDNVTAVPKSYYEAALAMIGDCKAYLVEVGAIWAGQGPEQGFDRRDGRPVGAVSKALASVKGFARFIQGLPPVPDDQFEIVSALEATLRGHFLCTRSLSEIFEIAQEEWHNSLNHLKKLQAGINPERSWRDLYDAYCPSEVVRLDLDTLSLYRQEIDSLRAFFKDKGFGESPWHACLRLCDTPTYLRSVRGSASFGAAFSDDAEEQNVFYLTAGRLEGTDDQASDLLRKRLQREYRFLSAHETFPGHHVLDCVRRSLPNPFRRQIESPLFYEGWATYAESLLAEYGYLNDPLESLVEWKRRLWRAARCQIDVGLNTGRLGRENAIDLLTTVGFASGEAQAQIGRFLLNPGYQLCYTLGSYEIVRLRQAFGSTLGRDGFHMAILTGGELPFHLIEQRFERLAKEKVSA